MAYEHDEFMRLWEPMHKRMEKYVLAMTRNREQASDLLHDTILIAYEHFGTLRDKKAFPAYVFRIASNLYKSSFRRAKFWGFFDSEAAEQIPDQSALPDTKPDVDVLYKALARLPEKYREALVLFEINGLSIQEIQEIQGGTISSVKVRLLRGRQKLAALLNADNPYKNFDTPPQYSSDTIPAQHMILER